MRFSQHNWMYLILLLFIHFPALILSSSSPSAVPCRSIDAIFQKSAENNETAACKCFPSGFDSRLDGIVIGCSGHVLPSIFKALRALNDTSIGKLRISDALVNILPSDMFKDMRMKKLQVERTGLAVLREGAFASLGSRLRELSLRHNNIKKIEKNTFDGLVKLQKLDLSGNRISSLESGTFDNVPELRELSINDNDISVIADGVFSKLTSLKKLSIVGNQINNISKNMFKGLDSLEVLQLQGNQITAIDWSAFNNLKQLKILDLGTNHVTQVELRGLDNLQKLFLNNNSINSLKNISLRDLPSLVLLSLDRNFISEIYDGALFGLATSIRFDTLTLAGNNISHIGSRALSPVQNLRTLALQNNKLTSLNSDGQSYLRPLKKLSNLLISGNKIKQLKADDLPRTIMTLAADHNDLEKIEQNAFTGISMQRLYLNKNKLKYLPKGSFDSFSFDTIEAIDVSSNKWECVCEEEWLGKWLDEAGERDVAEGPLGCLVLRSCGSEKAQTEGNLWVKLVACALAVLCIIILFAIAYLYYNDGKQKLLFARPLQRRYASDLTKLLTDDAALHSTPIDPVIQPQLVAGKSPVKVNSKKQVRFEGVSAVSSNQNLILLNPEE